MTEYKDGDKAVIKLVGADEMQELTGRKIETVMGCPILGKLEDFQPAQEKIKMTVEEKKEFDELRKDFIDNSRTVYAIMLIMFEEGRYPLIVMNCGGDFNEQLKLLECLKHPELIEVIKPEHEFKVGDLVNAIADYERAVVIEVQKNVSFPIHILFSDGVDVFRKESQLEFIKSNAINWEDGK